MWSIRQALGSFYQTASLSTVDSSRPSSPSTSSVTAFVADSSHLAQSSLPCSIFDHFLTDTSIVNLGVGIVLYFVSSVGSVALVKFLNYHFCYESWTVFALLSSSTWVWALTLHFCCIRTTSTGSTCSDNERFLRHGRGRRMTGRFQPLQQKNDFDDDDDDDQDDQKIGDDMVDNENEEEDEDQQCRSSSTISMIALIRKQFWLYLIISAGLASVDLLNAFSMTRLPGSFYALLKGSDIGFSMILSRIVLRRTYRWGQILGATLVMTGIALVFWLGSPSGHHRHQLADDDNDESIHEIQTTDDNRATNSNNKELLSSVAVVSSMCLLGAVVNAGCMVVTEMTLTQSLREENRILSFRNEIDIDPERIKFLLSNAYQMWTSLFAFMMLLPALGLSYQFHHGVPAALTDYRTCHEVNDQHELDKPAAPPMRLVLMISCLLLLLGVSRFVERLSKHWITVTESAVTFSLVQAVRRLLGALLLAAIFSEDFPVGMTAGTICSGCGFVVHYWSSNNRSTHSPSQNAAATNRSEYELVPTSIGNPKAKIKRKVSDQISDNK